MRGALFEVVCLVHLCSSTRCLSERWLATGCTRRLCPRETVEGVAPIRLTNRPLLKLISSARCVAWFCIVETNSKNRVPYLLVKLRWRKYVEGSHIIPRNPSSQPFVPFTRLPSRDANAEQYPSIANSLQPSVFHHLSRTLERVVQINGHNLFVKDVVLDWSCILCCGSSSR